MKIKLVVHLDTPDLKLRFGWWSRCRIVRSWRAANWVAISMRRGAPPAGRPTRERAGFRRPGDTRRG